MKRSGTVVLPRVLLRRYGLLQNMAALFLVLCASGAAQTEPVSNALADLLGPHNEGARGCTLCHASRSAAGDSTDDANGQSFLWGTSNLSYSESIPLVDGSHFVELRPASVSGANQEVTGVLICLSCHDGNLTPYNMMQSWSYEQQVGLLQSTAYGQAKIPSLLGREEAPLEDHPIGQNARINAGSGLVFSNGTFSVIPNSPYAAFVANYGWPSLAPGQAKSVGVTSTGEAFTLCTTCHNQHVRNVYVSGAKSPIAGNQSGKFYPTYFFVNGPYNPTEDKLAGYPTTSSAQFCRQCHFDLANEGNNTLHARTMF